MTFRGVSATINPATRAKHQNRRHGDWPLIRIFSCEYLILEGHDKARHSRAVLNAPKPEQSLPKILSKAQVNQLINTPDPKSSALQRGTWQFLELLYASGVARQLNYVSLTITTTPTWQVGMRARDRQRDEGTHRSLSAGQQLGIDQAVSHRHPPQARQAFQ